MKHDFDAAHAAKGCNGKGIMSYGNPRGLLVARLIYKLITSLSKAAGVWIVSIFLFN